MEEISRPWYDTEKGILDSLTDLSSLNVLLKARRKANRSDKRLHEFYVFGCIYLGIYENAYLVPGISPKDIFPDIPKLLTKQGLKKFLFKHLEENKALKYWELWAESYFIHNKEPYLEPENEVCLYCGKGWVLDNLDDFHRRGPDGLKVSLRDYEGKTVKFITETHFVSNLKRWTWGVWVSKSKKGRGYPVNTHCISNEIPHMYTVDDYIIRKGDRGYIKFFTYYYRKCYDEYLRRRKYREKHACKKNDSE